MGKALSKQRAAIEQWAEDCGIEGLIFYDPPQYFDHAIVGVIHGFHQEPAVVYDEALVLEAMAQDMGDEGAQEWFEFNTIGSWNGDATARFLIWRPGEKR